MPNTNGIEEFVSCEMVIIEAFHCIRAIVAVLILAANDSVSNASTDARYTERRGW